MRDSWCPDIYNRFKEERRQPFRDLCAMVKPRPGMRVLDLGCGDGEPAKSLHEQIGARETIGIDSSQNMLEKAQPLEGHGLRFVKGRIEDLPVSGTFDLIFSNAALHWVDGHEELFGRIAEKLAPGGQLAVQLPYSETSVFHTAARDVAAEYREPLGGYVKHLYALTPEKYAVLLNRLGFVEQEVVLKIYPHVLPSLADAVDWFRGTLLTAYESRLDAAASARFVKRYEEVLRERCEDARPFFFPYTRILMWARMSCAGGQT